MELALAVSGIELYCLRCKREGALLGYPHRYVTAIFAASGLASIQHNRNLERDGATGLPSASPR